MVEGLSTLRVRPPAVAGSFYPGSAQTLSHVIANLLATACEEHRPRPRGIIAPHAGLIYSGAVAAEAFASVRTLKGLIRRAAVIGPSHFVSFCGIAAPSHMAFKTVLGEMPVDTATIAALGDDGLLVIDDAPHAPDHAIEVVLPFLQSLFGNLPIVPLLFGDTPPEAVAEVIARLWTGDTLLVISSDLSHYERYETARRHDSRTAAAIEAYNDTAIGPTDACGHLAILGALMVAKQRGFAVERLALRNSGDAAGDKRSVVGYGAWAFLGGP